MTIPKQAVEAVHRAMRDGCTDEPCLTLPCPCAEKYAEAALAAVPLMRVQRPDVARVICERMDDDIRRADKYPMCPSESGCACWSAADAILALPHMGQPQEGDQHKDKLIEKLHVIAKNVSHALMSFTPGGSEYFTRVQVGDFEDYYADADVCQRRVRERIDSAEERARAVLRPAPQARCAKEGWRPEQEFLAVQECCERFRAVLLNFQSIAERGFPIDAAALASRCRHALSASPPPPVAESGKGPYDV